jgi:hypothetical protein
MVLGDESNLGTYSYQRLTKKLWEMPKGWERVYREGLKETARRKIKLVNK